MPARMRVCVCACVCVCAHACVAVCVRLMHSGRQVSSGVLARGLGRLSVEVSDTGASGLRR